MSDARPRKERFNHTPSIRGSWQATLKLASFQIPPGIDRKRVPRADEAKSS
jgi:hypothetical protein